MKHDRNKPLSQGAAALREDARKALLEPFAPTMVLNEWAATESAKAPKRPVIELPDLHPAVAQGVMEWLNDSTIKLAPGVWRSIERYAASIAARASA